MLRTGTTILPGKNLLGFICKRKGFDLSPQSQSLMSQQSKGRESPERWANWPWLPQTAGVELKFSSQPPSCKAQCDLQLETPLTMSVRFPHAAAGLRGQVGTIRISTHVLLGRRQMTRLMPLAPLVPGAETPRSPAHSGGRGSSCRGRAAGKTRGGSAPPPTHPSAAGRTQRAEPFRVN